MGWRMACERKVWSGRRKETRFRGEPVGFSINCEAVREVPGHTREVVHDLLSKLPREHAVDLGVRGLGKVGLRQGHCRG